MVAKEILRGDIVYLRACRMSDVTMRYVTWLNNELVNQYLETRFVVQTLDSVADYVKHTIESDNEYLFAIISSDTDKHIGNLHLTINRNHNTCMIAYFIGDINYWGKGRPVEILKLGTQYAFDVLKVDRMDAGAYSQNIFSVKAMLKAGYKKEGCRQKGVLLNDGTRDDVYIMGMLKEDYERLYKTPVTVITDEFSRVGGGI